MHQSFRFRRVVPYLAADAQLFFVTIRQSPEIVVVALKLCAYQPLKPQLRHLVIKRLADGYSGLQVPHAALRIARGVDTPHTDENADLVTSVAQLPRQLEGAFR